VLWCTEFTENNLVGLEIVGWTCACLHTCVHAHVHIHTGRASKLAFLSEVRQK
jgi:hypothetical protein